MNWNNPEDRAQLFLIGAIALALTFVGITLLLNSAIFSDNIASRNPDTSNTEIQDLNATTADFLAAQAFETNRVKPEDTAMGAEYNDAARIWEVATEEQYQQRGAVVTIEHSITDTGTRLGRDTAGTFTPNGTSEDNWLPIRDTAQDYELELYINELSSDFTVKSGQRSPGTNVLATTAAEVEIEDTGSTITVESSEGECEVETPNGKPNTTVVVDVTDGKINGQDCNALDNLDWSDDDGGDTRTLRFEDGTDVEGTWSLTTRAAITSPTDSRITSPPLTTPALSPSARTQYADNQADGSPYIDEDAIYSVEYTVWYETENARYKTTTNTVNPDANHLVFDQIGAPESTT